ncbi:MAG: hypothetical protein Ct9H90mP11_03580 [Acidimicrobiales bacterium]|nr:MAG: hypothetical protein Ct9H90mP11_03580 [Acidimicrobiales bacterium]
MAIQKGKGVIFLDKKIEEDTIMLVALENGAEDLFDEGDTWRLTCDPADLNSLREPLMHLKSHLYQQT